ncbi:MAG: YceI family protein [Deltaproteobacteria bacterium]|nr:YceI family protein [Deltaproteobacteria bacterium]
MLVLGLGLAACKEGEIDKKPAAKVEEAEKPADKPAETDKPAADSKTLTLASEGSKVRFIGAKVSAEHPGTFGEFSGSATVEGDKVKAIEVTVKTASLTTETMGMGEELDKKLMDHLKNTDFLDVEKYPEAKFTSLEITEKPGENGATHEISGNLTMKEKTMKVTFPAKLEVGADRVFGKADFKVDRKLWDITYAGMADDAIKDEVALELELSFPRA